MPTAGDAWPRPLLFVDRGCPFAHRVLALLWQLGVEPDRREAPVGQLPVGLLSASPSGRIPMLVHGAVTIGESRVMLEHLAEAYGFESAYARELVPRTLQRHAMAVVDDALVPMLMNDRATIAPPRLAECVDILERAMRMTALEPSLLAFHVAPIWLRFRWWRPNSSVTRAIDGRPRLAAWLDSAAALDAVMRTAPDQAEHVADFQKICVTRHGAED